MKVLFVTCYYKPAYTFGGPVVSTAAICENLVKLGVDVTVFTTNAGVETDLGVPVNQLKDIGGVEVWYFPLRLSRLGYFYASGIYRKILNEIQQYDIIYTDSLWGYASIPVYKASKSAVKPYIVQLHGQLDPWALTQKSLKKNIYLKLWGKRFLDNASGLLCTATIEVEHLQELKLRSLPFVVPLGLDISIYTDLPGKERFRAQYNIPADVPVILFLGRLHHKKRPDLAILVLSMLPNDFKNCHLVLAGPDQENLNSTLTTLAHELDCLDRVHFTGMLEREKIIEAFAASNLFIMPSEPLSENFGMSALEALAAGVPVLVSEGVPVGRWAAQAGAGKIVPSDPRAFAQTAAEMLANPENLKEMGQRGRELVRQKFDIQIVAQQMLDQFRAIVETGKPLPSIDN